MRTAQRAALDSEPRVSGVRLAEALGISAEWLRQLTWKLGLRAPTVMSLGPGPGQGLRFTRRGAITLTMHLFMKEAALEAVKGAKPEQMKPSPDGQGMLIPFDGKAVQKRAHALVNGLFTTPEPPRPPVKGRSR